MDPAGHCELKPAIEGQMVCACWRFFKAFIFDRKRTTILAWSLVILVVFSRFSIPASIFLHASNHGIKVTFTLARHAGT